MYRKHRLRASTELENEQYILAQLEEAIARYYGDWAVRDLALVGTGLDMVVWRAKSILYGDLAIRVPRQRFLKNENDGEIDSRVLLRQEATIARHVAQLGVPTPEVIAVHEAPLGDGVDFLAYEYIDNDSDAPCEFELGEVVRAIHDCKPPLMPWAMQGKSLAETIAERVVQRSEAVQRISGTTLPTPSLDTLYELLGRLDSRRPCLLHMDIRPNKNVLTRRGAIVSVIDWANALIGPPDLELARIQEYGLLSTEFLQGYGELEDPLEEAAMILCRLDTAIMLAVVFLSEAPDRQRAEHFIEHSRELLAMLGKE